MRDYRAVVFEARGRLYLTKLWVYVRIIAAGREIPFLAILINNRHESQNGHRDVTVFYDVAKILVRVEVVETSSQVWKTCILTAVRHSQGTDRDGSRRGEAW